MLMKGALQILKEALQILKDKVRNSAWKLPMIYSTDCLKSRALYEGEHCGKFREFCAKNLLIKTFNQIIFLIWGSKNFWNIFSKSIRNLPAI